MSDSSPAPVFQALLLQSETHLGSNVNILDTVLSSSINKETETGFNARKVSSCTSTVTSISTSCSCGTSRNVANNEKELTGAAKAQSGKAGTSTVLQINALPHPVDEFLLQLTKMLTDDNKDYIGWHKASVFVADPPGLEKFILPRYYRHSNYSTFVSVHSCSASTSFLLVHCTSRKISKGRPSCPWLTPEVCFIRI